MKNNKGMTLVELLVTFSLLLIIVVGLYNLILEVKFEIDNKQIVKDTIEYSSLINNDIHYNLLIDKPFAIAYNNDGVTWNCAHNSNGTCVKDAQKISVKSGVVGITNSFNSLNDNICKRIYPCAVYYSINSENKIDAKVIALNKYIGYEESAPDLVVALRTKGILYGKIISNSAVTPDKSVFEPIPNPEYTEIRDDDIPAEVGGNPPKIEVTDGVLIINYGIYVIDDDQNYGFKIAYPFS